MNVIIVLVILNMLVSFYAVYLSLQTIDRSKRLKVAINLIVDDLEKLEAMFEEDTSTGVGNTITSTAPLAPILDDNAGNRRQLESTRLPKQGHAMIVGKSGSGKSNVAMGLIIERIQSGQQIYIIDTKNELGPLFKRHCAKVVDENGADRLFSELAQEAKRRQDLFAEVTEQHKKPCRDLGEYFKITGNKLPIITLVIEELVALSEVIDQSRLVRLLVIGRSAGIFVLALAQYLRKDVIDRKGSINFNTKVFLGAYDRIAFDLLFGSVPTSVSKHAQEYLGAPGKGVVEEGGEIVYRSFPRVHDYHLEAWI